MKNITITLYEFDELPKDVQAEVLDSNRYVNTEYHDWYEPLLEDAKAELAEKGYEDADIRFSGFGSQGDGASFTATLDLAKFPELAPFKGRADVRLARTSSMYMHPYVISVECTHLEDLTDEDMHTLDSACERVLEEARSEMHDIYRKLEKAYFTYTSDGAVAETIRANEWTFEADGTMRND